MAASLIDVYRRQIERERDLARLFREVGFDVDKLLTALAGYGRLHPARPTP
jgi:hypothetical protein